MGLRGLYAAVGLGCVGDPWLWACARGSQPLIRVHTHLRFQVWAPSPLIWVPANCASGVFWGCLSGVHSPGAEGVGEQEAMAAVENSLSSL